MHILFLATFNTQRIGRKERWGGGLGGNYADLFSDWHKAH
jgi:hypothetical protein